MQGERRTPIPAVQTHQGATSGSRTRRSQRGLLKVQTPAAGTHRDAALNHKSTSQFIFTTGLKHLLWSSRFSFTTRHRVVSKHRWCQPGLLLPTRNLIPPETAARPPPSHQKPLVSTPQPAGLYRGNVSAFPQQKKRSEVSQTHQELGGKEAWAVFSRKKQNRENVKQCLYCDFSRINKLNTFVDLFQKLLTVYTSNSAA